MKEPPINFGEWLTRRRKSLNLTREMLAQRASCTASAIRQLEADDFRTSVELAEALARALEISVGERPAFVAFARGSGSALPLDGVVPAGNHPVSHLPAPLTGLVGRRPEIAAIVDVLRKPAVRLLTLTGPPGTGKTRLSLAAAQKLEPSFRDGAYFVALAPVTDPAFVVSAIMQTLGVREAGTDGFETLSAYLHDKRLLLVLDNFEHLLTAAPLVANLLKAAPQVRALVSSREILHLSIEHEFPVPALELLDVQHLPTTQSLLSYSRNASVSLFKERACAAQPDFHLTPENVADVARICAWLDGLPLAIEIAAAQIKSNTPEQLFAQLRDRLGGLTSGPRDLSPRQQSLHGAIDWSWNLLTKPEQRLFRRLSAFFGGWTLESAQAVCGGEIAGLNAALVNKSLVVVDQTARGGTRHHFHEMVRQYANEKLVEAGEDESIRTRHLKYNFELIDRAEPGLAGPQQQEWLDRLDDERDNLRGALAWSLASGAFREGLQAVCQSWMLWVLRGMISEGNQWCTSILAAYPGMDALRLRGLQLGIVFARQRGDAPQKRAYLDEARALAKTIGLPHALSHDLREEALYEHDQGDVSKAIELLDEALSHFRQMEDEPGLSETLFWLAEIWMHLDELETSRPLWEEGIAYMRRRGDAFYLGWGLGGLAEQAQREGKFAEATSLCRESMSLKWKSQDKGGIAFSWETFAMIATSQGRCERAVVLWGASARYREMIQSVLSPAKRAEKEHYIDQTRAGVGRHDFEELWQRGRTMSTEQILEFALSD